MNTASRAVKCLDPQGIIKISLLSRYLDPVKPAQIHPFKRIQDIITYDMLLLPLITLFYLIPPPHLTTLNFYVLENFPRFNLNISCIIVYPRERVFTRLDPRILSKVGFKRFTAPGTVSAGLGLYLGETLS